MYGRGRIAREPGLIPKRKLGRNERGTRRIFHIYYRGVRESCFVSRRAVLSFAQNFNNRRGNKTTNSSRCPASCRVPHKCNENNPPFSPGNFSTRVRETSFALTAKGRSRSTILISVPVSINRSNVLLEIHFCGLKESCPRLAENEKN